MGLYTCCPACPKKFSKKSTLNSHRNGCNPYKEYQSNARLRRAEASAPQPGATVASLGLKTGHRSWRDSEVRMWANQPSLRRRMMSGTSSGGPSTQTQPLAHSSDLAMPSSPSLPPTSDFEMIDDLEHPYGSPESDPAANSTPQQPDPVSQSSETGIPPIRIRIPPHVRDRLPERVPTLDPPPLSGSGVQRVILYVRDRLTTAKSTIGLWREYLHRPTFDPDSFVPPVDLAKSAAAHTDLYGSDRDTNTEDDLQLHKNSAWSSILEWQATGSEIKSNAEVERLVKDYLLDPSFRVSDLQGFSVQKAVRQSEKMEAETKSPLLNNFFETKVPIELPSGSPEIPPRTFHVPGLHYRPILSLLRAAFAHPLAAQFHFSPFKLLHTSPLDQKTRRVHSEVYDSDAFIEEHDRVQRAKNPPDDPHCKREKVVAAIMLWSDSTHLANFGTAKLWPIYMFLGNLSKYVRALPNSGACQHVAYIPSLPDSFQDELSQWHSKFSGKSHRADLTTHCRRELMHGVWRILLSDEEFLHAYKYGIVIKCLDGIERRVFPRIFSYSADYPEKVLLATIRDKGLCGCPRCLIPKDKFQYMGRVRDLNLRVTQSRTFLWERVDIARFFIYKRGHGIKSKRVEDLLKPTSSVPTVNAFVENLGRDFPLARMLGPDFMHEFELGVWKLILAHLIRLLYAVSPDGTKVLEFDLRFRLIRTFGASTIRNFANNTSEMKKLAARDFEDILQCCIPVFDGLFDDENGDNRKVLKLLYRLAEFHAFAKLRMHTAGVDGEGGGSLDHLEQVTSELGKLVRQFRDDFSRYQTIELPSEATKRARNSDSARSSGPGISNETRQEANANSRRRPKELNISTYKFHSLGDYPAFIRLFGGSDSISTQPGELEHRLVKRLYARTNKRSVARQIAKRVQRIERARLACERRLKQHKSGHVVHREKGRFKRRAALALALASDSDEADVESEREFHTYISCSENQAINLFELVKTNADDPAYLNFIPKLRAHLLGRRLNRRFDGDNHDDFTHEDVNTISIRGQKIYRVATCQVNYTTYDNRRDFDTVNPSTHPDIMVYSQEENRATERFWYARVLGIYHAKVSTSHPSAASQTVERMHFLFVRWYGSEPGWQPGFRRAQLPKVGFVKHEPDFDNFAFGFLDPAQVLRGCHLIPVFRAGLTKELLPYPSAIARQVDQSKSEDWVNFYVNIFVDRDMIMRYYGGGIGHHDQNQLELGDDVIQGDVYEDEEEPEPIHVETSSQESAALSVTLELGDGDPGNGGLVDMEEDPNGTLDEVEEEDSEDEEDWEDNEGETDEEDDGHYASD